MPRSSLDIRPVTDADRSAVLDRDQDTAALSFVWSIEHGGRSAWLDELYVSPGARGHGVGTQLLRDALGTATEAGAVAVDLEVDVDHQRAAKLYEREGFATLPRARWVRTLP